MPVYYRPTDAFVGGPAPGCRARRARTTEDQKHEGDIIDTRTDTMGCGHAAVLRDDVGRGAGCRQDRHLQLGRLHAGRPPRSRSAARRGRRHEALFADRDGDHGLRIGQTRYGWRRARGAGHLVGRGGRPHAGIAAPGAAAGAGPHLARALPGGADRHGARLQLLRARHLRRHRHGLQRRELRPRRRPALLRHPAQVAPHRGDRDRSGAGHRLSGGLSDRDCAEAPADTAARHASVLEQLPDPDLRLDRAAQPRGPDQQRASLARPGRRALAAALQRHRPRDRPGLRLPAVHGPAALRLDRPAQPIAVRFRVWRRGFGAGHGLAVCQAVVRRGR